MLKSFALLGILVVAAPSLAAADNQNNNSGSQNLNALTANDPPTTNLNSKGLPAGFPPVPGCNVLATDPDDRNGLNGDDKKPVVGNPHCRPASP